MSGAESVGLPQSPWEPGVRLSVGVSRSGKTYRLRRIYFQAATRIPLIILDRTREIQQVPAPLGPYTAGCSSVREAIEYLEKGKRIVVVQVTDCQNEMERACEWARKYPGVAGIAMSEAHRAFPNGKPLMPASDDAITAWAHFKVAMFLDTQRLAKIDTTVSENASELCLFTCTGSNDFDRMRDIGGRELEAAVREAGNRFDRGEPGWHVKLGVTRRAPPGGYVLTRET